jgi:hypothetical protein
MITHQITLGSATYRTGDRTRLVNLHSSAALEIPVNTCRMVLSPPMELAIAPGDAVQVEVGSGDRRVLIFSGSVGRVEWQIDRVTVQAVSAFQKLLAARFNLLYEKSKGGDIVQDVIGRLDLTADRVDNGIEFPVYTLGDHRTAHDHLQQLARQCGFDFYANPSDQAVFAKYRPASPHELQYGVNVLAIAAQQPTVLVTGLKVYGESPSSFGQGAESYSWLTKQTVEGTAGSTSGIVRRVVDATARTQETAGQIATALLEAETVKRRGSVQILGDPTIQVGQTVKLSQMAIAAQNGSFKVTRVVHSLNAQQGFCSQIHWEEP